jgi:hypothetical protein
MDTPAGIEDRGNTAALLAAETRLTALLLGGALGSMGLLAFGLLALTSRLAG